MNLNRKEECASLLSASLSRTSRWRDALHRRYPSDTRNARAAERLLQLADEAANLTDEQWAELERYYNWSSESWVEAVSQPALPRLAWAAARRAMRDGVR
jgi:hypothetical protein